MRKLPLRLGMSSVVVSLLLLGTIGCGQAELPGISQSGPGSSAATLVLPTASPTLGLTYLKLTIIAQEREAETPRIATRIAQLTSEALTPTVPRPTYPPVPTRPPVDLPLGVITEPSTLVVHGCECSIENLWRGRLNNGDYINLYAGVTWADHAQGMIAISTYMPNDALRTGWEFYVTPVAAGSVHTASSDGLLVTLISTSGMSFIFDASTRAWLSLPDTMIPVSPTSTASP